MKAKALPQSSDRIVHQEPPALARFNYNVPAELERITRKCLEKDRERRYQSTRDLLTDLRNLQRDAETGALSTSQIQRQTQAGRGARARKAIDSLAILPFANVSNEPGHGLPFRRHHREHYQQPVTAPEASRYGAQHGLSLQRARDRSARSGPRPERARGAYGAVVAEGRASGHQGGAGRRRRTGRSSGASSTTGRWPTSLLSKRRSQKRFPKSSA